MKQITALVAILATAALAGSRSDQPSATQALCGVLAACGVPGETPRCTGGEKRPVPGMTYSQEYCGWVRSFERRGMRPGTSATDNLYRWMGSRHHVMYVVDDTVPVPFPALQLLIDNVPLTAKLINSYRGTLYRASFPIAGDSLFFRATNGRRLSGEARQLHKRRDRRERIWFGRGDVTLMRHSLTGNVIIEMRAFPHGPRSARYSARFTMFPANEMINTLMNMDLFRQVALAQIREILDDVTLSARDYAQGRRPDSNPGFTVAERAVLARFEALFRAGNSATH